MCRCYKVTGKPVVPPHVSQQEGAGDIVPLQMLQGNIKPTTASLSRYKVGDIARYRNGFIRPVRVYLHHQHVTCSFVRSFVRPFVRSFVLS